MSLAATLNRSTQSFSEFWAVRNPRERMLLAVGAAAVLLALIYLLLISPAQSGREQLAKSLPAMRQQVAQLQALSKEASSLPNASTSAASVQPISRESLEAALARKGLKAQTVAVTGEIARLQLPSVSFSSLISWIDDMQKNALLSVEEANIVALPQPDTVNATLMLRQRKTE